MTSSARKARSICRRYSRRATLRTVSAMPKRGPTFCWRHSRYKFGEDNVYAWAKEQAGEVSHEMFDEWMRRNDLSLSTAAEALGISRRMVSYYRTAHKAIPRTIWLACLGWEATRPKNHALPRALPTAREDAAAHA